MKKQVSNLLKVLIVEDEEIIRKGLVYTIDWLSMGCMVMGDAANGAAGLELIKKHTPDIVLTDIIMPEVDGLAMIEAAKKLPGQSFQTILLTSYAEFEYARKAVQLGVTEYLLKPVDEEELAKTIKRIQQQYEAKLAYSDAVQLVKQKENDKLVDWEYYLNDDNLKNSYVTQALYKIRDHYHEKISIESIAEEFDVSASYLSRKFKEATSHTFVELLSKYRIQKAIGLLKKGTYRVYEVSDLTGFNDYKNFCVVFKKYMKNSPKEFMKNVGGMFRE